MKGDVARAFSLTWWGYWADRLPCSERLVARASRKLRRNRRPAPTDPPMPFRSCHVGCSDCGDRSFLNRWPPDCSTYGKSRQTGLRPGALLLDKGADVNAQGGQFGDALQVAQLTATTRSWQRPLTKVPTSTLRVELGEEKRP